MRVDPHIPVGKTRADVDSGVKLEHLICPMGHHCAGPLSIDGGMATHHGPFEPWSRLSYSSSQFLNITRNRVGDFCCTQEQRQKCVSAATRDCSLLTDFLEVLSAACSIENNHPPNGYKPNPNYQSNPFPGDMQDTKHDGTHNEAHPEERRIECPSGHEATRVYRAQSVLQPGSGCPRFMANCHWLCSMVCIAFCEWHDNELLLLLSLLLTLLLMLLLLLLSLLLVLTLVLWCLLVLF